MNKLCLYSLITSQKEVDLFLKNKDFYFKNIEGVDKFILLNGIEINDELSNCFDNNVSIKKIVSKTKLPLPKAVLYFAAYKRDTFCCHNYNYFLFFKIDSYKHIYDATYDNSILFDIIC